MFNDNYNNVPRKPRNTTRVSKPIRRLKLEPLNQLIRNNNVNRGIINNRPKGKLEINTSFSFFTEDDRITFMRLVDTMHDLTERDPIAKRLGISPNTLLQNIRSIYGNFYADFYKTFATSVMKLEPKEYNNIKVIKTRLYNYITKLPLSQFDKGRRVEFQFDTPITSNRVSDISPVLLNKLMRTSKDTRFVVDATKYSLDTNMRLESVKHSNKQLLTFAQLIDPSTISGKFDKYLFEIHNDGHFPMERYVFAYIHTFTEMQQRFDYYYVMRKDTFTTLQQNNNAMFLDNYLNMFAIVCFRSPLSRPGNNRHVPFLNAYVLNTEFFGTNKNTSTESFVDNLMFVTFNDLYRKNKSKISFENFHVYKSSTFTKDKLSVEKLVDLANNNNKHLLIALEYKRSFDSLQMHYQAYLNNTPYYVKYNGVTATNQQKALWNLFHNSTIISFDILSGLFGYLYGANVMLEYRGTYRMFSIDQTWTMTRLASASTRRRIEFEQFRKLVWRLAYNSSENSFGAPINNLNNNDKRVVQAAINMEKKIESTNNLDLSEWIQKLTNVESRQQPNQNNSALPIKKRSRSTINV
jgi:hypothetical protein